MPLPTSMGLIGIEVAGPGTAESGLGKKRSGSGLGKERSGGGLGKERSGSGLGKRDQEDSCPRQTDEVRGTAVDDFVARNASKNLRIIFKEGDIERAGSESGSTNVDTL